MTQMLPYRVRCPACRDIAFYMMRKPEPGDYVRLYQGIFYRESRELPDIALNCEHCGQPMPIHMVRRDSGGFIAQSDFVAQAERNVG